MPDYLHGYRLLTTDDTENYFTLRDDSWKIIFDEGSEPQWTYEFTNANGITMTRTNVSNDNDEFEATPELMSYLEQFKQQ